MRTGLLIPGLIAAIACGEEHPSTDYVQEPDTIVATRLAVFGEIAGADEFLFGRVAAVAADGSGAIYVADGLGSTVRAYDSAGRYLGTVGTEGEGPGEFLYLRGLAFDRDDNLHVLSAFRISVFTASHGSAFADSLLRTLPVRGIDTPPGMRGKTDGSQYYIPGYTYQDFLIRGYYYVVVDSTGNVMDTVSVPAFPNPEFSGRATYPTDERGRGPGVEGVNRAPFEAAPTWDITTNGHLVSSAGDEYEVVEISPDGDTVQVVSRVVAASRVPQADARDSLRAFRARLDSIPVPLDQMRGMSDLARRGELPSILPEILDVQVDGQGNIWLKRWPRSGHKETLFDVLAADGSALSTVRVPADLLSIPGPWVSPALVVGVVRDSVNQVDRVAVFGLSGWL